ncbi:MAG: class I SAM-dependent methyltransferase [Solirubrobacterales bacterium]
MRATLPVSAALGLAGVAYWLRKHPSACPYSQRFFVELPHPLITRERLRAVLCPEPGERVLEIGPGTGYYTLDMAAWVGPGGRIDIFDIQQQFLDHTLDRASRRGLDNVHATQGDARELPYEDGTFDACVLVAVLGEIPDPEAALREIGRVLRSDGRLVVGELAFPDPHFTAPGALRRRAEGAGLRLEHRDGPPFGYFARLVKSRSAG